MTDQASPASKEPQTAQEFYTRGWFAHVRKDYKSAESDFQRAVSLDPSNADAYYALGLSQSQQGLKAEAKQAFKTALALLDEVAKKDPARATILRNLAKSNLDIIEGFKGA